MAGADVIVVGAGVAGSVVAGRLAETGRRVTLVEAGPAGPLPPALRTVDAVGALAEADRFWPGVTARGPGGRAVPYRLGRGAGGGSAVNAMVVTSGDRADYDRWAAERDCPGWAAADLEPWLARAAGTVGITEAVPGPLAAALGRAATAAGHPQGGASLALDATGYLAASLTARGGQRRSAADAYLGGGSSTGGPEVLADVGVRHLVHRNGRVTGVELHSGRRVEAGRVVLCAGAVHSPRLLWASGITAPALGRLVDHPSYVFTVELRPEARQAPDGGSPPISALLRWPSAGTAEAGGSGTGRGGTAGVGAGEPDVMALAMDHVGPGPEGHRYGAVIVALTAVASAGRIEPAGGPLDLDPAWLTHPDDRTRLRRAVRHVARLLASGAVAEVAEAVWLDDRGTPLDALAGMDDDRLDTWLADHPGPVRHPAASAPMGRPGSPVAATDPATGALAGWDGLHLADASVLPWLPNANPMLPVLAVAERLAAALGAEPR